MDFDHLGIEARSVALTDVDLTNDGLRFSGYAAVFDQETDMGEFTEEVRRGAFRKILSAGHNVPMYWDHDPSIPPLATTRSGTLKLTEDPTGLRVEAELDEDHYMTPTLRSMIRRGDVSGMSFGFIAGAGNSKMEVRGQRPHRVLTGFNRLLDVSPTWEPAYAGTSAELRSLVEIRKARVNEVEQQIAAEVDGAGHDQPDDEGSEQRTGVSEPSGLVAARRRLHIMGLTLPKS